MQSLDGRDLREGGAFHYKLENGRRYELTVEVWSEQVRLRIDGHEVADIAAHTGRSKRSVERVLQQFRDQLQGLLDDPA